MPTLLSIDFAIFVTVFELLALAAWRLTLWLCDL
jgi:hypothetical protein